MMAAMEGNTDIAKALIEGGDCLDLQDKEGNNVLMIAAMKGNAELDGEIVYKEQCLKAFKVLDINKDGFITNKELKQEMKAWGEIGC